MKYELAKELKEAGFPQGIGNYLTIAGEERALVYDPTLSELIEACGENFFSLYRDKKDKWQAHSNSDQWDTEISHGSTPEEAVARLWLAIK